MQATPSYLAGLNPRRDFFHNNFPLKIGAARGDVDSYKVLKNSCPCCGYRTYEERSCREVCSICFWEDDGQDDYDADEVYGGPNGGDSLTDERKRFYGIKLRFMELDFPEGDFGRVVQQKFAALDSLIAHNRTDQKDQVRQLTEDICYLLGYNRAIGLDWFLRFE